MRCPSEETKLQVPRHGVQGKRVKEKGEWVVYATLSFSAHFPLFAATDLVEYLPV